IVLVTVKSRNGDIVVDTDELPKAGSTAEGLAKLRPASDKAGTVTAGYAAGSNDGAPALLLMNEKCAKSVRLAAFARIRGYAPGRVSPAMMGLGHVQARRK
ncbi:acetyl-CoA C-acetyltransferase, partial [Morganella morganii]|nr:acetyl-CoA C-acetyltransferase [Morganella morganii]